MRRGLLGAIAEALQALAVVAWVGGHTALGAYAARILFRDLPRAVAAPAMTTIFRSFDGLIAAALILLAVATLLRLWAVGLGRRIDRTVALLALLLLALGGFELGYVHPNIETMFRAGRSLDLDFHRLHTLSERCGHLEVVLAVGLVGAQALARKSPDPA